MAHRPIKTSDRVFLAEDAREWMPDIGVRPGRVVMMDGSVPVIEWFEVPGRSWMRPEALEVMPS